MVVGIDTAATQEFSGEIKKKVKTISNEFNLDARVDEVKTGYLENNAVARTSFDGIRTDIEFDKQKFFCLPETQRDKVILHELLHVKQFRNTLGKWLRANFNTSEDFVREFESIKSSDDMEGEVELLIEKLMPEIKSSSYPHQKVRREREIKEKGIDPEKELLEDIENLEKEILGNWNYEKIEENIDTPELNDFVGDYLESLEDYKTNIEEMLSGVSYNVRSSGTYGVDVQNHGSPNGQCCTGIDYGLTKSGNPFYSPSENGYL